MTIDYIEAAPMPACCAKCDEADCYACDHAGERWRIPPKRELELKKKIKERAITRFQREIAEIDRLLANMTEGSDNNGVQC